MNDNATRNTSVLPTLSDDTIDRWEENIFTRIDEARTDDKARAKRKRSHTVLWSAAAAVTVVAGAAIAPGLINGSGSNTSADGGAPNMSRFEQADQSAGSMPMSGEVAPAPAAADGQSVATDSKAISPVGPEAQIITTAFIAITVTDVEKSSAEVTKIATDLAGYVSSQNVGSDPYQYGYEEKTSADPLEVTYGSVTLRVPEDSVTEAITQLEALGTVTSTSIDRMDVTQQSVDLSARVDSLKASVERLEELMTKSASVADLIEVETALSARQAELESLQQQLDGLTDQVAMSTINVTLQAKGDAVKADPDGFGDGLVSGWNSLVAAMNGFILGLGFILPWIVIVAAAALIIWLIVRARRGRGKPQPEA